MFRISFSRFCFRVTFPCFFVMICSCGMFRDLFLRCVLHFVFAFAFDFYFAFAFTFALALALALGTWHLALGIWHLALALALALFCDDSLFLSCRPHFVFFFTFRFVFRFRLCVASHCFLHFVFTFMFSCFLFFIQSTWIGSTSGLLEALRSHKD